jgi:hypothetical protein
MFRIDWAAWRETLGFLQFELELAQKSCCTRPALILLIPAFSNI